MVAEVPQMVKNNTTNEQTSGGLTQPSRSEHETIDGFISVFESKDISKLRDYLVPEYQDIFINRYLREPIKLSLVTESLRETSTSDADKMFDANLTINYVYSSGSATLKTPVTFKLRRDKVKGWLIYQVQVHQLKGSTAVDYKQMAEFYKKIKNGPYTKSGLNLFSDYEVRLLESSNSVYYDSSKSIKDWAFKLQEWVINHPLSEDMLVYSEKTNHGYKMLVTSFDDGNLLYLGISDTTGEIIKIYVTSGPIDLS
jgi:hypothetical protein